MAIPPANASTAKELYEVRKAATLEALYPSGQSIHDASAPIATLRADLRSLINVFSNEDMTTRQSQASQLLLNASNVQLTAGISTAQFADIESLAAEYGVSISNGTVIADASLHTLEEGQQKAYGAYVQGLDHTSKSAHGTQIIDLVEQGDGTIKMQLPVESKSKMALSPDGKTVTISVGGESQTDLVVPAGMNAEALTDGSIIFTQDKDSSQEALEKRAFGLRAVLLTSLVAALAQSSLTYGLFSGDGASGSVLRPMMAPPYLVDAGLPPPITTTSSSVAPIPTPAISANNVADQDELADPAVEPTAVFANAMTGGLSVDWNLSTLTQQQGVVLANQLIGGMQASISTWLADNPNDPHRAGVQRMAGIYQEMYQGIVAAAGRVPGAHLSLAADSNGNISGMATFVIDANGNTDISDFATNPSSEARTADAVRGAGAATLDAIRLIGGRNGGNQVITVTPTNYAVSFSQSHGFRTDGSSGKYRVESDGYIFNPNAMREPDIV